ncbi:MAG: hypothetical protein ACYTEU_08010 [Planctomycetota bacterium]|jgi:hypothetical protein
MTLSNAGDTEFRRRIRFHKYLAYSFVYMAKANKIGNHIGLYRQYMKYAKEHLDHAKRLKEYMANGVRITKCVPVLDKMDDEIVFDIEPDTAWPRA